MKYNEADNELIVRFRTDNRKATQGCAAHLHSELESPNDYVLSLDFEDGEFVMVVRRYGDRPGWWISPVTPGADPHSPATCA